MVFLDLSEMAVNVEQTIASLLPLPEGQFLSSTLSFWVLSMLLSMALPSSDLDLCKSRKTLQDLLLFIHLHTHGCMIRSDLVWFWNSNFLLPYLSDTETEINIIHLTVPKSFPRAWFLADRNVTWLKVSLSLYCGTSFNNQHLSTANGRVRVSHVHPTKASVYSGPGSVSIKGALPLESRTCLKHWSEWHCIETTRAVGTVTSEG